MTVHPGSQSPGALATDDPSAPDAARERRRGRAAGGAVARRSPGQRRGLALALVGALVGGLVGLVVSLGNPEEPTAVTRLSFVQDPPLPGEQASTSPDAVDRFVQTQILILTGADIRDTVAEALGLGDELTLAAQQVGATDIVELQVQAATLDAAREASTAVIEEYEQQRRDAVTAQFDALLAGIEAELADLQGRLGRDDSVLATATATEYSRLLASRSELVLQRSGEQDFVQAVGSPRAATVGGAGTVVQAVLLGLLLGAVVGVALALIVQRTRPE